MLVHNTITKSLHIRIRLHLSLPDCQKYLGGALAPPNPPARATHVPRVLRTRSLRLKNAELGHQRLKNAELDCRQNASETVLPSKKVRFIQLLVLSINFTISVQLSVFLEALTPLTRPF